MALNETRLRLGSMGIDSDTILELGPVDLPPDSGRAAHDRPVIAAVPGAPEDRAAGRTWYEVIVDGWRIVVSAESAARAALRERATRSSASGAGGGSQTLRARIPGRIAQVWVAPGSQVQAGDRLLSIEAMKMENEIRAPHAGTVHSVAVRAGDRVELGADLVVVGGAAPPSSDPALSVVDADPSPIDATT